MRSQPLEDNQVVVVGRPVMADTDNNVMKNLQNLDEPTYDLYRAEEILNAIEEEQLTLVFQPQIDLSDNKVIGAEALVRWKHPSGDLRSPLSFIPFASETGLIEESDKKVIRQAFVAIKEFERQGLFIPLSINLSARSMCKDDIIEIFKKKLLEFDVEPSMVHVKITEASLTRDLLATQKTAQRLQDLGISIALDDFGSGSSSLNYLLCYPSHFLKIDEKFICQITQSDTYQKMVASMITIAHALKIAVVAEGGGNPRTT